MIQIPGMWALASKHYTLILKNICTHISINKLIWPSDVALDSVKCVRYFADSSNISIVNILLSFDCYFKIHIIYLLSSKSYRQAPSSPLDDMDQRQAAIMDVKVFRDISATLPYITHLSEQSRFISY